MWAKHKQRGFTIVELLIVIVVIGILAAITIVAYNGIQGRAQVAAVSSALDQTNRKLAIYMVDNSAYPPDLATAGINNSGGTTYQYSVNNAVSPQTYCVTATDGSTSYKASSVATAPTSGGCPGHGVGGVAAAVNLVTNPSAEVNANDYHPDTAAPTITSSNLQAYSGSRSIRLTSTTVSTDDATYFSTTLDPGTYAVSYMVYSPVARSAEYFDWGAGAAGGGVQVGRRSITANTWTQISGSITLTGSSLANISIYIHNGGGPSASGQDVFIDAFMISSTVSNYADGNSPNWVWNGTPNNSTSTGPAL